MKYCCCGCSIQFGTLLILWMDAVPAIYCLFEAIMNVGQYGDVFHACFTLCFIIEVIITFLGIFGVHSKKAKLLLPYYLSQVISLIFTALIIIAFLILSTTLTKRLNDFLREDDNFSRIIGDIFVYILNCTEGAFLMIIVIIFVIHWYFAIVVHSCYRLLLQKKSNSKAPPALIAPIVTTGFCTVQQQQQQQPVNYTIQMMPVQNLI